MDVKPKRHRCVSQLIDAVHGFQAACHANLEDPFPKRTNVGDHVHIAGFGILFAIVNQGQFKERCTAAIRALEAKRQERTIPPATEIATFTVTRSAAAETARKSIPDSIERNEGTVREASLEAMPPLAALYAGEFTAGQAFPAVYASENPDSKKYWTRQLLIAATDAGDRSMLITALLQPPA